jgi:flagellar motor switch protein FliM
VELDAVLDQIVLSLNDVMNWRPGSQILLNAGPSSPINLRCGEIPLFVGGMGQKNGNMAIKIDKKLRKM